MRPIAKIRFDNLGFELISLRERVFDFIIYEKERWARGVARDTMLRLVSSGDPDTYDIICYDTDLSDFPPRWSEVSDADYFKLEEALMLHLPECFFEDDVLDEEVSERQEESQKRIPNGGLHGEVPLIESQRKDNTMASFLPTITATAKAGAKTGAAATVADRLRAIVQSRTQNTPLALLWDNVPPEVANYIVATLVGYAAHTFEGLPGRIAVQKVATAAMQGSAHDATRRLLDEYAPLFKEVAALAAEAT